MTTTFLVSLRRSLHRALCPPASRDLAGVAEVAEGASRTPLAALLVHEDARLARPVAMTFGAGAWGDCRWGSVQESLVRRCGHLRGREDWRWCNRRHRRGRGQVASAEPRWRVHACVGDCYWPWAQGPILQAWGRRDLARGIALQARRHTQAQASQRAWRMLRQTAALQILGEEGQQGEDLVVLQARRGTGLIRAAEAAERRTAPSRSTAGGGRAQSWSAPELGAPAGRAIPVLLLCTADLRQPAQAGRIGRRRRQRRGGSHHSKRGTAEPSHVRVNEVAPARILGPSAKVA